MCYQKEKQDLQKKGSKVMTSKRFSVISFLCNNPLSAQINLNSVQDVRAALMKIINAIIEENSLTQAKAGKILGIDQSNVSNIKRLQIKDFALGRLFLFLLRLNYNVKLVIGSPKVTSVIVVQLNMIETKIALMCLITDIVTKNRWSQRKAGELLKMDQSKMSNIKRLKVTHFSIKRLINSLILLGYKIELIIERASLSDE